VSKVVRPGCCRNEPTSRRIQTPALPHERVGFA
jgi:hypothetical protein